MQNLDRVLRYFAGPVALFGGLLCLTLLGAGDGVSIDPNGLIPADELSSDLTSNFFGAPSLWPRVTA